MTYPTYLYDYEVFPFAPLVECKETLQTMTNIIKGNDGTEQRICIRNVPRQSFDFSVYLGTSLELATLQNLLFGWQKGYWALPVWMEKTLHMGTLSSGSSTITFNTAYADYRDATLAIVWQDYATFEVVLIDTVYPTYISLTGTTSTTFTGNKYIMPCRIAQMITPSVSMMSNRKEGIHQFSFMVVDNVLLDTYSPSVEYPDLSGQTNYEVVEAPSYVEEELNSDGDLSIQDYGIGDFEYFSESDYNIPSRTYKRQNYTKANCWNFRLWLHSFYGRQLAKWFPTYKDDLTLISSIGPSDVTFEVENVGLTINVGVNALRGYLAFITNTNSYYRQITDISELTNGNEQITIDASIGATIQTTDIVCFLEKCRLASDEIEITWKSGYENECNLTLIGVQA